jgi:hypothetical protein
MNEQQLADLFTEQIDRMLAGETVTTPVEELSELLNLGQQFHQVSFQAGPAAQAAFQGQLAGWFGSIGAAGLGLSKGILLAMIAMFGTGISLVALMMFGWLASTTIRPVVPTLPATQPVQATPVEPAPAIIPSATSKFVSPTETIEPEMPASESDTLPAFSSAGDTLPITATATVTMEVTPSVTTTATITPTAATDTPPEAQTDDDEDNDSGPSLTDDHDRGHGNDPDGVDEDNPGNSSGAGQSSNQNKDKDSKGNGKGKNK